MNPTLETIHALHSTHGNFTTRKLTDEQLEAILAAAVRAPNSSNRQCYSILVLDDPHVMKVVGGYEASHALVFVVDFTRLADVADLLGHPYQVNGLQDFLTGAVDVVLAAENAALAAQALGVDTLFTNGLFRQPLAQVASLLGLPETRCFPLVGLMLGFADHPPVRRKGRYAGPGLIHRGRYQRVTRADLPALHAVYDADIVTGDDWRKAGLTHYLDWYYTRWARSVPAERLAGFETALRQAGFLSGQAQAGTAVPAAGG